MTKLGKSMIDYLCAFKVDHTAFLVNETCQSFFCLGRDISSLISSHKAACKENVWEATVPLQSLAASQPCHNKISPTGCIKGWNHVLRNIYAKGKQTQGLFFSQNGVSCNLWCLSENVDSPLDLKRSYFQTNQLPHDPRSLALSSTRSSSQQSFRHAQETPHR